MSGLLSSFKNPFTSGGLLSDPNVRLAMGAEMLRGGTLGEQLGNGLNAGAWFSEQNKTKREALEKTSKTVEWLKTINPEIASAVEMGALSGADGYKMAIDMQKPQHTEFQDRAAAASQYGLDQNTPEGKAFILSGDFATPAAPEATSDQKNYEYSIRQLRERGVPDDKLPTFQEWSKPKNNGIKWRSPDGTEIQIGGDGDSSGPSIPAEVGARIGLGNEFLAKDYPEILKMIDDGDATGVLDFSAGVAGRGNSGIVQRRMATGIDALKRALTGAGQSESEVNEYASRYAPKLYDDTKTLRLKAEGLKQDLEAVARGAINGKAGNITGLMSTGNTPAGSTGNVTKTGVKWGPKQ